MNTEAQTAIFVLQISDELAEQLQPFMAGLDITVTVQRLTMRVVDTISKCE